MTARAKASDQEDLFGNEPRLEDGSTAKSSGGREHRGRNDLNDLNTREWLLATKSVWYQNVTDLQVPQLETVTGALREQLGDEVAEEMMGQIFDSLMLSKPPRRDPLKIQHPATFAETDIERLIRFFSKAGETVLDPFLGSGTTLMAARACQRKGIGIEVSERWAELAAQRLDGQPSLFGDDDTSQTIMQGDAELVLPTLSTNCINFIVTSPPYWSVLNKPGDHKVKEERTSRGLETNYSDADDDLGNIESYDDFLSSLAAIFGECHRVLNQSRYIAVVVSDFRDKSKFYLFHADIASILEECGFSLSGITVLAQDSKTLYPYGMPYAFVSNIHHQYVVIARKTSDGRATKSRSQHQRRPF